MRGQREVHQGKKPEERRDDGDREVEALIARKEKKEKK